MFHKFGQIIQNTISASSIPVSIALVTVFASLRYFYPKSRFLKGLMYQIYNLINENSEDNLGTNKYWIFFSYYFLVISLNGIFGALAIGDLFGHYNIQYGHPKMSAFLLMIPASVFVFYKSIKHKGIKAITDLAANDLPLPMRIMMFPIEFIVLFIKLGILPFRLAIHAYISHEIAHALLSIIKDQIREGDVQSIIIIGILIFIKFIDIISGGIQGLVFTINMSILFGKLYKSDH